MCPQTRRPSRMFDRLFFDRLHTCCPFLSGTWLEDDDRLFFDRLSTFVGLPTGVSLAVVGGLQRIHRCVVPMELGNRQWFEGGDTKHAGNRSDATAMMFDDRIVLCKSSGLPVTF
jgi:hypothetical protein